VPPVGSPRESFFPPLQGGEHPGKRRPRVPPWAILFGSLREQLKATSNESMPAQQPSRSRRRARQYRPPGRVPPWAILLGSLREQLKATLNESMPAQQLSRSRRGARQYRPPGRVPPWAILFGSLREQFEATSNESMAAQQPSRSRRRARQYRPPGNVSMHASPSASKCIANSLRLLPCLPEGGRENSPG